MPGLILPKHKVATQRIPEYDVDEVQLREPRLMVPGMAPTGRVRVNPESSFVKDPFFYAIWVPNSFSGNLLSYRPLLSGSWTTSKGIGAYCTTQIILQTKYVATTDPDTVGGGFTGLVHGVITAYSNYNSSIYAYPNSLIKNQDGITRLISAQGTPEMNYSSGIFSVGDEFVMLTSAANNLVPYDTFSMCWNITKGSRFITTGSDTGNFYGGGSVYWYGYGFGVGSNNGIIFMQAHWARPMTNDGKAMSLLNDPYQLVIPA